MTPVAAMAPVSPGDPAGAMTSVAAVAPVPVMAGGLRLGGDNPCGEQHRRHDERRRQFDPFRHSVELLPFHDPFADLLPAGGRRPLSRAACAGTAGALKRGTTGH